jgi:DNA-binding IclR family transcriptional regulator
VLTRAVRLLGSFDGAGTALTLSELCAKSDLPMSTTLRLARRMLDLGLLERLDDGRFVIGIRLLELGSRAHRGNGIRAIALPYLEELHRATGHYVLLGVLDVDEAVVIERLSPMGPVEQMYSVGTRMPLAVTGLGLALLAFAPPEFQAEHLAVPRVVQPEGVVVDPAAIRARLARVRTERIATISRPVGRAWASIGCPILGPGDELLAAISVVAPPDALRPNAIRTAVVAIAGVISRQLGGAGSEQLSGP